MKKTRRIISGVIWTIVGLYALIVILLQVPAVQKSIGRAVAGALSDKLGTEVSVGRVNLGFLNRIIIDDVHLQDQSQRPMLSAARLSAKFEVLPLTKGRIVITSAQLFGLHASLLQETPQSKPNFQFVLDSLASKDTTSHTPLDLKINSLVIRRGTVAYDKLFKAPQPGKFSPDHIRATDISAHIMLNALQDDSLNLNVKRMSMKEASGLNVKNLKLKLVANRQQADLQEFFMELPHSLLEIDHVNATYRHENGKFMPATLQYECAIPKVAITLSDLKALVPAFDQNNNTINFSSKIDGTSTSVHVGELNVSSPEGTVKLQADGSFSDWGAHPRWNANVRELFLNSEGIKFLASNLQKSVQIPEEVTRLGDIAFVGTLGGVDKNLAVKGQLETDAGNAQVAVGLNGRQFTGHIATNGINLQRILEDDHLGLIETDIDLDGQLASGNQPPSIKAKGMVKRFDYNGYTYNNINIDGSLSGNVYQGMLDVDDPNISAMLNGSFSAKTSLPEADLVVNVRHLKPAALHLTDQWNDKVLGFSLSANVNGRNLNTLNGRAEVNSFSISDKDNSFEINNFTIDTESKGSNQELILDSDFGHLELSGRYDIKTLAQSLTNHLAKRIPTLPGFNKGIKATNNEVTVKANIKDGRWLQEFFNIPLTLHEPLILEGYLDDANEQLDLHATLPNFTYDDNNYKDAVININTPADKLKAHATITRLAENGHTLSLELDADAANNHLATSLFFDNQAKQVIKGQLNADTQFFTTSDNRDAAHVDIHTSEISINDTIWHVEPGNIVYSKNDLTVDHLAVKHENQHIIIDGRATKEATDTLFAELKDIDVKYILDLVNFHSVEFSGRATGLAHLTQAFDTPEAATQLRVDDFRFQNGRMGVLTANARLNNELKQIDIHAVANDNLFSLESMQPAFPLESQSTEERPFSYININGYVSPQRNDIELFIDPHHARGEFLESFCGSFMRNVNIGIDGNLRLYGLLSAINLTGTAVANGTLGIIPLNTTYTLRNDTIQLIPNEIIFANDTIYDNREHIGIVTGALHHQNLKNLTYDIGVEAQDLLAFDVREFGDDTFCGTVYGTGNCMIRGRSGEVTFDIDVTPDKGSEIRYNAASPDAISNSEFITWHDRDALTPSSILPSTDDGRNKNSDRDNKLRDIPTDVRLNFNINATPSATLKVIMDQQSGDYIALNGNGSIRATYYNKGSFDMFGNYNVDHGIYKLTIQNVIKKDFQFQEGSTIAFGGDPYNAALNLKAQYTVAGVPLSDLNIGRSFTSNNIRVNCLMNIMGTPGQPRVEFDLDMPTVGTDAKQMIFSLINSEEEMNQQVLYLLAVGRFYNQSTNNASEGAAQQSQTSLAMQSLLSGTISQQINSVLSSVVKNQNWNFGANISTGDQGFYNAEYEGLLSGRLLNNRLLINGEFGYRDNPNATSSFISDFDIRYLLLPNGNLSIKVYNQTNDRYFTRNSLNTQGIGLLMKKDFSNLSDLFNLKKNTTIAPANTMKTSKIASEMPSENDKTAEKVEKTDK